MLTAAKIFILFPSRYPWTPRALFTSGDAGCWYDPSDLSSMFQDSAGTTPAAVNSPVGRINDKSGNGNYAVQATSGLRPLLKSSAGLFWLEADGVDDFIQGAFTIVQPIDRISAIQEIARPASGRRFMSGVTGVNRCILYTNGSPPLLDIRIYSGAGAIDLTGEPAYGTNMVVTERHDGSGSRAAINKNAYVTGDIGTDAPGGLTLFAEFGGALPSNTRNYGVVMIGRRLSDAEITLTRGYLAAKSAVTL